MLAGAYGCQQEEHPFSSTTCPIVGGSPDTTQEHMAVVYLQMIQGQYAAGCTGTLIGPRIVLTAAHCVYDTAPEDVTVFFGSSTTNATARHVSEVLWHTGYRPRRLSSDIAMVRLDSDPPAGIVPIPFLPNSMKITDADIGRLLEFVGFGVTETGSSGTKMTVHNELNWVCTSAGGCDLGGWGYAVQDSICQDQTPGGPCSGDSGGPAFVLRAGKEYVCGITSYGDADGCRYYGCSTKVDEYEDFIRSFGGEPQGTPCTENIECISNACVDYVCCENECAGRCEGCSQPGFEGLCVQLPNGTPCPDSDVCNGEETCSDGSCQRGEGFVCQDAIECTVDTCDPVKGCDFQPLASDCDDQEVCTRDLCNVELGCVHEPLEDGLECAKDMFCASGECKKKPKAGGCASSGTGGSTSPALFLVFLPLLMRSTRRAGYPEA
jgi:hypothetical protein